VTSPWLVYGATGYTGELIARDALARGLSLIVAGRGASVASLAAELGCAHRIFALDDPDLPARLEGVFGVCHVAGPFSATAAPMMEACLATGVHYLDLATELEVFERAAAADSEAKRRGVVLMPGSGFNVAVTDCVAVALHEAMPAAERLHLAVDFGETNHSYGGAVMGIEALAAGTRVREDDIIRRIPGGSRRRRVPLRGGDLAMATLPFPFGDLVSARHSTGIRNIEIYLPAGATTRAAYRAASLLRAPIATRAGQRVLKGLARWMYRAPDDAADRARVRTTVWGEVADARGSTASLELSTRHSYAVTSEVAVRCMAALTAAPAVAGFRTPGRVLGPELLHTLTDTQVYPLVRRAVAMGAHA
jgi:short subunit dehydrogenase-like uncharacterized protein